jgi:peptide/nickel transport system substrate-binding protein
VVASSLALALIAAGAASAQKSGGSLKVSHFDSPASMSPLEEATIAALRPTMGVFNNLVMYSRTSRKRACNRSSQTWRRAGRGTRTAPS